MICARISADRGEVEAEAGVGDDQHVDVAGQLARQHGALHVAARQVADRASGDGRLDAIGLDELARPVAHAAALTSQPPARLSGGWSKARKRHVLGHRHARHAGVAAAAPRAGTATLSADLVAPCGSNALAVDEDRRRLRRGRWPASASTSSRWPLPETPAMPTISPACTFRIEPSTARRAAVVLGDEPVDHEQRGLPRRAPLALGGLRGDSRRRSSSRPCCGVESATWPPPTSLPRRSTVTASPNASPRGTCG